MVSQAIFVQLHFEELNLYLSKTSISEKFKEILSTISKQT